MDLLAMLSNAKVVDSDGEELGEVVSFTVIGGSKLIITCADDEEEDEEDDPDGEESEPIDFGKKLKQYKAKNKTGEGNA